MAKFPKITSYRVAMAALLVTAVLLTLTAPVSTTVVAQTPQCLPTGQAVNGDTTGLTVEPCPQPRAMSPLNGADTALDPLSDPPPGNFSTLYWGYEAAFTNARRCSSRLGTGRQ